MISRVRLQQALTLVVLTFLGVGTASADSTYAVKADASGDFATIQACADAMRPGDTCVVYAGTYNEHVRTAIGGTSDQTRITFRTQGQVTMQGFDIRHPYVTIQGFDITGYTAKYSGHVTIFAGGSFCRILNNILRDGAADVLGVYFYLSAGQAANNCVMSGNRLSNLNGNFLTATGNGHLFENNVFELQNNRDYVRLFGAGDVFRRNVFWRGTVQANTGNHPDLIQNFGGVDLVSENHLFEENWIQDLPSQFSQLNSGDGVVTKGVLYDNVRNITFRRNVIVNVSMNANVGVPGVRFENNTFYRMAYEAGGIFFGGSLTRGNAPLGTLSNNVFLAGGARAEVVNDSGGFYAVSGFLMSREVIGVFVTNDPTAQSATTAAIYDDLRNNGYIDPNGKVLRKAATLTDISQFVLNSQYQAYKTAVYDRLMQTVRFDQALRSTFSADYNFVAGAESVGFPAKRNSACDPLATYSDSSFCEAHGINGGDPHVANLALPLGADGIPFTLDDGLKPQPTSPLCGRGQGGADIGAYSCDAAKVFSDDVRPQAPTNVRVVR